MNRSVEVEGQDGETAWECHKQLDAMLAWRTGYLLIAQTILIAGFAALYASGSEIQNVRHAEYAICVFAIFLLFAQWSMSSSVSKKLAQLRRNYLQDIGPIYREYAEVSSRAADDIQLIGIPIVLWVLWVILFELALWTQ